MKNGINQQELTQDIVDELYEKHPEMFDQDANDTITNVVDFWKLNNNNYATIGNPRARCPHCKYITLEADILDEVIEAEVERYKNEFPDLKFY